MCFVSEEGCKLLEAVEYYIFMRSFFLNAAPGHGACFLCIDATNAKAG